jgi:hypothetical protein
VAEIIDIPGDFKAPENPPIPPARPDFGDRVQLAAVPAANAAPEQATRPAPHDVTGSLPAITNLPPQTTTRAEAASLGAYEFKTAGAPLPEGGLRATSIAYAPAQFELAGVSAAPNIGHTGGARWRAAYDDVQTDCFPETLRKALDQIAAHFKSEVLVTSGKRDRGRRGSLHRSCKAADIRIVGVSPGEVARVARVIPGINGVGTYRRLRILTFAPSGSPGAGEAIQTLPRLNAKGRRREPAAFVFQNISLLSLRDARRASTGPCPSGPPRR